MARLQPRPQTGELEGTTSNREASQPEVFDDAVRASAYIDQSLFATAERQRCQKNGAGAKWVVLVSDWEEGCDGRVTLPLAAPRIMASAIVMFLESLKCTVSQVNSHR